MANDELKRLFRSEGIYMWEIAKALGVHEMTLSRRFRTELAESQKQDVMTAFERVKADKAEGTACIKKKALLPSVTAAPLRSGIGQRPFPDDAAF